MGGIYGGAVRCDISRDIKRYVPSLRICESSLSDFFEIYSLNYNITSIFGCDIYILRDILQNIVQLVCSHVILNFATVQAHFKAHSQRKN